MRVYSDCRFRHSCEHSGGLPGYGSNVLLIPEHDIGVFALANRTLCTAALVVNQAAARLYDTGALRLCARNYGECREWSEMDVRHALSAVLRYPCDRRTLTATVLLAPAQEPWLQRLDFSASD